MKKRILKGLLAFALALVLIVGLVPGLALRAEAEDTCTAHTSIEGGNCTTCGTALVAQVGSTYYATAKEAFTAAGSGDTVTILATTTVNDHMTLTENLVVNSDVNFVQNGGLECQGTVTNNGKIDGGLVQIKSSYTGSGSVMSRVENYGTINGGTFDGVTLTNKSNGTISGGTFNKDVYNYNTISGGEFNNQVYSYSGTTISGGTFNMGVTNLGTIKDGKFNNQVNNYGTISGGTFNNQVYSYSGATISSGTFNSTVETSGVISGGTFSSNVTNTSSATISDGIFNGTVENLGTISGGTFSAKLTNTGTVYPDNFTLSGNFQYNDQGGTESCTIHKHTTYNTPATCQSGAVCYFCGTTYTEKDANAHSLTYTADGTSITQTCSNGCTHSATATLTLPSSDVDYNGTEQKLGSFECSSNWKGSNPELTYPDLSYSIAGEKTVVLKMGEVKVEGKYTIAKLTPTADHFTFTAPTNLTYDGSAKAATVELKSPYGGCGKIYVYYLKDGTNTETDTAPTDAGTYQVSISVEGSTNFLPVSSGQRLTDDSWTFTIEKAETVKTAPVAIEGLVYDGTAQALITAGEVSDAAANAGYTMMYSLNNGDYSSTVPTATNAGTYKIIWYAGYDTGNFKLVSGTIEVTIAKKDITYTAPTANTLTYNGAAQALVSGGRTDDRMIEYKLDDGEWSASVPTAANAGTYQVAYRIQGGENYNDVTGTAITVTLAPYNIATGTNELRIGIVGGPFEYDGTAKTGTASAKIYFPTGGNPAIAEVSLTKDTDFTVAYQNNVKAGTATAIFTGKGNYTGSVTRTFEISKKALALTVSEQTITYGKTIDATKYTIGTLASGDSATVTLTPSTDKITASGSIAAAVIVKNAAGEDVTGCYEITNTSGKLTIQPDLSAIENLTVDNVHYSDTEDIQAVQEMLNGATDDTATQDMIAGAKTKCAQLLTQIDESLDALETDAINATLEITASNVKLTDKATITAAIADIKSARETYGSNYSDTDKATLNSQLAKLENALASIEKAEAVIAKLNALPTTAKAEDDASAEIRAAYNALTAHEKELVMTADTSKKLDLVAYKILSGNKGTWEAGKSYTFKIDGDYDRFTGVKVDGKALSTSYYTKKEGSTIVTLKESYIKKIASKKEHTVTFLFNDGQAEGTFYLHKDAMNPATGDTSDIGIWVGIMIASAAALAGVYLFSRKKKNA